MHALHVTGADGGTSVLTMQALHDLPRRRMPVTMECAGNWRLSIAPLPPGELWGSGAVSSATWTGVSLSDVLAAAGIQVPASICEVLVEGADAGRVATGAEAGYARSLPVSKALDADTVLALWMNDEPLLPEHGAPVRLLVPGWYGMASVKWVTRIALLDVPFTGYFQSDRYVVDTGVGPAVPVREMAVKAMITPPAASDCRAGHDLLVQGWAWAGRGDVSGVEVAIDGGDDWQPARLHPSAGPYLWRRWEFLWRGDQPGRHVIRARARSSHGDVQPDVSRWNRLGYEANGIRLVEVTLR
jgi:DMSO/TMAO reductase YedYZ molybdopterin-dependent catalytic subunit